MTAFRVALAGLGNAALTLHLPGLAATPRATVVGGCDPSDERRAQARARFNVVGFPTLEELIAHTSPQVVVVCAPPAAHRPLVETALKSEAHVICEKPLATTIADAEQLVALSRDTGRRLALNHEFREMAGFRALLDAVRRDGTPTFAQAWQNMDLPPWAEPGWRGALLEGVLYEAGIHLVDFVIAAFGETPTAVTATMSSCGVREEKSDAVALVTLEFSRGRLAQITQNRFCKGETQYFEVRVDTPSCSHRVSYGGRARVSAGLLRSTRPHLRLEMGKSGLTWEERGHQRRVTARNPGNAPAQATGALHDRTLRAFADGSPAPVEGSVGLDVLRVLAAAYLSAAQRRTISLAGDADQIARHRFEG
jgi:scyllo-inositol 2-dehydrogenase (NADP+)